MQAPAAGDTARTCGSRGLANDPANTYDNAIRAGIESVTARTHSTLVAFFAGFDPATQLAQCTDALASGGYDGRAYDRP